MLSDHEEQLKKLFTQADKETKRGNLQNAIKAYQEIVKISERDVRAKHIAFWGIGEIYLNAKEYEQAEYYLKEALKLAPDEPSYHYLLGCTYRYKNDIEKALKHLGRATEIDPACDIYWAELGWVYGYNQDIQKGIEYLKKALSINRSNLQALRDICMLYAKNYQFNEALVCIEEAIEQDPGNEGIQRIKEEIENFQKAFHKFGKG
jgi:tetratricopeptide (TPR) repeat protein